MKFLNYVETKAWLNARDMDLSIEPTYAHAGYFYCWIEPPKVLPVLFDFIEVLLRTLNVCPCLIQVDQYRNYEDTERIFMANVWDGLGKGLDLSGFNGQIVDRDELKVLVGYLAIITALRWQSRLVAKFENLIISTQGEDNFMCVSSSEPMLIGRAKTLFSDWQIATLAEGKF